MSEPRSRAAEHAASQVGSIVEAAEKSAAETRRQAEHQAREILEQARNLGRKEYDESRRKALELIEDARKEASAAITEARAAADAVLAEAQSLAAALKTSAAALTAEADRLVRDVQLTHRELLAELRLPGLAGRREEAGDERPKPGSFRLGETPPRRPGAGEVFDLPDWLGGES